MEFIFFKQEHTSFSHSDHTQVLTKTPNPSESEAQSASMRTLELWLDCSENEVQKLDGPDSMKWIKHAMSGVFFC